LHVTLERTPFQGHFMNRKEHPYGTLIFHESLAIAS